MGGFTPGPWSHSALSGAVAGDQDRDGWTVVACSPVSPRSPKGSAARRQWEADARLIAAAPDLLSELKRLTRAYVALLETGRDRIVSSGGSCDPADVMEAKDPALISARAVIAKAEG